MSFSRNKILAYLIVMLMTAAAVSAVSFTPVNAAENIVRYGTHIYVSPTPLVGVGEQMFIVYFTDRMPLPADDDKNLNTPSLREGWAGIKIVVTKPNGENETFTMGTTDPVGAGYHIYTPDTVGVYSVQAFFPETWKNRTAPIPYGSTGFRSLPAGSYYFNACNSPSANFTVQTNPVTQWTDPPLPTQYWMRPIGGPANTWSVLAGNWLGGAANVWPHGGAGGVTNNYAYGPGPESPHILWTRQYFPTGSIVDTRFGAIGNAYVGYQQVSFSADPILDGKIHVTPQYTVHDSSGGYEIWDLYTGELLTSKPNATRPSHGQILWYDSGNQGGCLAYLWKTTGITLPETVRLAQVRYDGPNKPPVRLAENKIVNTTQTPIVTNTLRELLDAYTGNTICYIANVSATGTQVYGKDGSILYYNAVNRGTTANPNYYLTVWNSSAGTMVASQNGTGYWQWRPSGGSGSGAYESYFGAVASNNVHDGNLMWSLNVSMPSILAPRNAIANQTATIRAVREGQYIVFGTEGSNDERGIVQGWMMGISLERGKEGQKLWESTFTPPFSSQDWYSGVSFVGVNPEQEVIVYNSETELINAIVYDLKTGQKLWQSDGSTESQLTYYGSQLLFYEDMIITGGQHSGILTAYEARTGNVIWTYTASPEGTESPYGNDLARGFTVADGKLYTSVSEHSPSSPLWRTPGLKCLDIETGEELWKILFWGAGNIKIADGILVGWNWYDGQTYAFGRGPSATTVTASPETSMEGTKIVVKGTVTDQTPTGRRNVNNVVAFTLKGTPAISDEDMRGWMEYQFMGQGKPANAKGVPVTLSAIDPNGNYVTLGNTTSDINGNYGLSFTPEVPGDYQIIATFEGSKSYYPSTSSTFLTVDTAQPQTTTSPNTASDSLADTYLIPLFIATIIAIVVATVVIVLAVRKRP